MYFDIHRSTKPLAQRYWWVAKGGNNKTLCSSEMLSSKQDCIDTIRVIMADAATAAVYDETGDRTGDAAAKRILTWALGVRRHHTASGGTASR
jgi:uncharacterized protein YegP (UPF0339 family)